MQRLKATHIDKVVIGISELDSALALLVCVMAFDKLGYDKRISMPLLCLVLAQHHVQKQCFRSHGRTWRDKSNSQYRRCGKNAI